MDMMFAGWNADYPDAYDFFHILLDGRTIHAANNNNLAYINNATLNKEIDAADALTGDARAKSFGKLDIYTMTKLAPWICDRQPRPARLRRTEYGRVSVPAGLRGDGSRHALPEVRTGQPVREPGTVGVGFGRRPPLYTSQTAKPLPRRAPHAPLPHPPSALGRRAVHRRDGDQLCALLPDPDRPREAGLREDLHPVGRASALRTLSAPTGPIYVQYGWFLGRLMPVGFKGGPHLKSPNLGPLVRQPRKREHDRREGRAGDGVARDRRDAPVDADRRADRDPAARCARDRCSTEHRWSRCSSASPRTPSGSA